MMVTDDTLANAIHEAIDRLHQATTDYAEAAGHVCEAVAKSMAQQREVDLVEATVRFEATSAVVNASDKRSAPERDAMIAHIIATHARLREVRDDALRLRERVEYARTLFLVADQAQKSVRDELAALVALCRREVPA